VTRGIFVFPDGDGVCEISGPQMTEQVRQRLLELGYREIDRKEANKIKRRLQSEGAKAAKDGEQ
jgi:hypothetical protein